MKKLHLISWIILIIGILFKFSYWPGASLLLMIGCLMMLIFSIIYFVENVKSNIVKPFLYVSSTLITVYFLFRIQYWAYAQLVFGLALLIGVITLVIHLKKKEKFRWEHSILILYFVGFIAISYVHSDRIFYLFNRSSNENQNNKEHYYTYEALDKYSWFLYLAEKYDEAESINEEAILSVKKYIEFATYDTEAVKTLEVIEKHKELIRNRNWVDNK